MTFALSYVSILEISVFKQETYILHLNIEKTEQRFSVIIVCLSVFG